MEVDRIVQEELLSETVWMKSLQSLTLMKHGLFENYGDTCKIRCRLLDHLLHTMFTNDPIPDSLERLWIHHFYFPLDMVMLIAPSLKAFKGYVSDILDNDAYGWFRDLEHFSGLDFCIPMDHLPNLKTACGYFRVDDDDPEEVPNSVYTFLS